MGTRITGRNSRCPQMIRPAPSNPFNPCPIPPGATASDRAHAIAQRYKTQIVYIEEILYARADETVYIVSEAADAIFNRHFDFKFDQPWHQAQGFSAALVADLHSQLMRAGGRLGLDLHGQRESY